MLFEIPIIVVILQSIPEGFFIVMVGLKLFNIDIQWKRAGIIAIIYGIVSNLIRKFVTTYGIHTILGIIALMVLVKVIRKMPLWCSTISILVGSFLVGFFQVITVPWVLQIAKASIQELSQDPFLMVIAGIPTFLLMGITYIVLQKTGFSFYNLNELKEE